VNMKKRLLSESKDQDPEVENCERCVVAPIDYYGRFGRSVRHVLLKFIVVGQPLLVALQKRRTPLFTKFMRCASLLGFEEFFTFFVVFLQLCIDTRLARLYVILMALAFYTVGFVKAALCLPRPRLPLVKPLESALDWALPSNHTMSATCLPLYCWFYSYLHKSQLGLNSVHCICICLLMCLWSVLVMFSRLYLGVHSPADIVSGGILGCILLSLFLQIDDQIDLFISQKGIEPIIYYLIFVIFLVSIFPSTDMSNPCCSDAVILLGVVLGAICARSYRSGERKALFNEVDFFSFEFCGKSLLRMAAVVVVLAMLKPILKEILRPLARAVYEMFGCHIYSGSVHIRNMKKDPLCRYAKHLQPSFRIPPITLQLNGAQTETEALNKMADKRFIPCTDKWNYDLPVNFVTYGVLQYTVSEYMPQFSEWMEQYLF
jgi:membrane-associated phospholipid phosphatase